MNGAKGTDTMPVNGAVAALDARTVQRTGLLTARVGARGRWAALRALRAGMSELRAAGDDLELAFIVALAPDGRIVGGRDPAASLFVLGYRLRRP